MCVCVRKRGGRGRERGREGGRVKERDGEGEGEGERWREEGGRGGRESERLTHLRCDMIHLCERREPVTKDSLINQIHQNLMHTEIRDVIQCTIRNCN